MNATTINEDNIREVGVLEEIEGELAYLFSNNSYVHDMELLFSDELEKWHAWESRALTQESLAALIPTLGACFMFGNNFQLLNILFLKLLYV